MDDKRELRTKKVIVTTAGTRVPLNATKKYVNKLWVKALSTNTGLVFLGDVSVSSTICFQLSAKEEIDLSTIYAKDNFVIDLNEIYIDSAVNGEGVSIAYFE
jgi:hypothetical protein